MSVATDNIPRTDLKQLPKRTRLNVRQSKNGCFTCKARRLKCDEGRPTCWRCENSGKFCEGYRSRQAASESRPATLCALMRTSSQGGFSLKISSNPTSGGPLSAQRQSYSRLGLEVLLQESLEEIVWSDQPAWIRLLAQCVHTNVALTEAVVLLGTVYEAQCIPDASPRPITLCFQSQRAIVALQTEIELMQDGPVPVFLAIVVLAAAEVLQRAFMSALAHLRGAYALLTYAFPRYQPRVETDPALTIPTYYDQTWTVDKSLHHLARLLDLQTAWYALSRTPQLPQSQPSFTFISTRSIRELGKYGFDQAILSLLHSCYHFAAQARRYKYLPHSEIPSTLLLEQSHYIAALSTCVAETSPLVTIQHGGFHHSTRMTVVQRVQCLSTLIYLSMILSPYELAYDAHGLYFQEIIDLSREVVRRTSEASRSSYSVLLHFNLAPGIFQALYLTAMKYRDPYQRRQAIDLLSHLSIEGPWNPQIMCAIAWRAIEIEECSSGGNLQLHRGMVSVPEEDRLHGCGLESTPGGTKGHYTVATHFSLCKDVKRMVQSRGADVSANWTLWTEVLEV